MGDRVPNTRGLALLIKTDYACNPVGRPSPHWLFVRLFGGSLLRPIVVGTCYIPHNGRNGVLTNLAQEVEGLRAEYPNDPFIVTGDWNMSLHSLQRKLASWPRPLFALGNYGNTPTTLRGSEAIDHIAYWGATAYLFQSKDSPSGEL